MREREREPETETTRERDGKRGETELMEETERKQGIQ
jgi:hypothetical protein